MKGKLRVAALFVIGFVALFVIVRVWNGGDWARSHTVIDGVDTYPAHGLSITPWVLQFAYALGFIVIGAVVSIARRPKQWREGAQPWLMAAALLFLLSGIGVLASDRLRVIATGRDAAGLPWHHRVKTTQGYLFLGEALIAFLVARRLRLSK
jgi:hypothetical protein